jgi:hypothetical protein
MRALGYFGIATFTSLTVTGIVVKRSFDAIGGLLDNSRDPEKSKEYETYLNRSGLYKLIYWPTKIRTYGDLGDWLKKDASVSVQRKWYSVTLQRRNGHSILNISNIKA